MSPPPLDGAPRPYPSLVPAREDELKEALGGDEGDAEDE